jgi:prevent-host-death family protein
MMKAATLYDAKTHLSALLSDVEAGDEVVITRHGKPVARLVAAEQPVQRQPGDWRSLPAWAGFTYDPAVFAPLSTEEAAAEGWEA